MRLQNTAANWCINYIGKREATSMNLNATLLGQVVIFILFVWFTLKYIWPPLMKAMKDRQKKIVDGLAAAEQGRHKLQLAKAKVEGMLREAKQESSNILDQTNMQASKIVDAAKIRAQKEGQRLIDGAKIEIEQQIQSTKEALQKELTQLVIAGAGKILEKEVDQKTHEKMLDQLISEI